jgi:hypothetical protein
VVCIHTSDVYASFKYPKTHYFVIGEGFRVSTSFVTFNLYAISYLLYQISYRLFQRGPKYFFFFSFFTLYLKTVHIEGDVSGSPSTSVHVTTLYALLPFFWEDFAVLNRRMKQNVCTFKMLYH